jgi:NitT/TauT family transport system ATP-binding protein
MMDASSNRPLITVKRAGKSYTAADGTSINAIAEVSCAIDAGEFVSIIGPSGCGKSTFLMMLAGLLKPSSGEILLGGSPVSEQSETFGIVFQQPTLFPWRTVSENVELPGEINGLPKTQIRERAQEMLELVDLVGFESKYPNELSGGMQQRVAIARALSLDPPLLLMDEPFAALDALTREQMAVELQRIHARSKATILFVTHSISEAAFLSDHVIVMTGRPSTVRGIVAIDLERPRSIDCLATDRFGLFANKLRTLLAAERYP